MIRILIFSFFVFISAYVQSDEWQGYWIKAVEYCDKKQHDLAKEMFDLAIFSMEENKDINHPEIYVDRARLNLLLENNELALVDLDKALSNDKIAKNEKSRAAISRMIVRSRLGMDKGVLEDLKFFAENSENKPIYEKTKEHIIIRNVPDCSCYKNLMTCYYIHSGICLSKTDIQRLSSGIWIVKKNCDCKNCAEILNSDRLCDACGSLIKVQNNTQEKIDECKAWCDRMSIAGASWCARAFKTYKCQAACAVAIYEIQRGCFWCCEGEGFYKRCVKPFEDIGKYIQPLCDPMWD